jgi:hypothetical protein
MAVVVVRVHHGFDLSPRLWRGESVIHAIQVTLDVLDIQGVLKDLTFEGGYFVWFFVGSRKFFVKTRDSIEFLLQSRDSFCI